MFVCLGLFGVLGILGSFAYIYMRLYLVIKFVGPTKEGEYQAPMEYYLAWKKKRLSEQIGRSALFMAGFIIVFSFGLIISSVLFSL